MNRRCPRCGTSFPDEVFFCGNDGTITVQEQDPSDFDPRLGTQLGGYLVVARVADGAMGRVFEGRHPETRARVAIKVLHAAVAKDAVSVERFKREFETANEFDHPHIVKVLEFGETPDGSWFLTMEYLEGEELGDLLRREGAIPRERALRILCQAALALDHAHSFGVIHRDLKPDNIFLCSSEAGDDVRLLDFGSVKLQMEMGPKLTAFGTTLGSPYYMSPEQAMGKQDVDQRTDVFALAAILFEMSTGRIAFEGSTVAEILMKIVAEATPVASAVNPSVSAALDEVIDRGARKEKTERYSTSVELADAACLALGLSLSAQEVAESSASVLAARIGQTTPAALQPFGAGPPVAQPRATAPGLGAPPSASPSMAVGLPPPMEPTAGLARSSNLGILVAVGLLLFGMLAVGGVVVAYLLL